MQSIYTYIPETNYVPREYSVAAVLLLLFMVLISLVSVLNLLYFYISTFRSMCAVPNMAVFCSFIIIIIIIIIIILRLYETIPQNRPQSASLNNFSRPFFTSICLMQCRIIWSINKASN